MTLICLLPLEVQMFTVTHFRSEFVRQSRATILRKVTMTHFMLDGELGAELVEKLNNAARALLNRLETIFAAGSTSEDPRAMARALFASVNGVLISFRNYPGRDRQAVFDHMQFLGSLIARRFN